MTESIRNAVEILRAGGLVAIPTETVYGLAADATNASAVQRIFEAKGRPSTNPLIVHVADANIARRYARQWPQAAQALAERFWPGPLTLVVPRSKAIVPQVTAGLDSVGLRAPDHPLALQLLRAFDGPLAAPSANRSNRISPTTAEHVKRELGDAVGQVLDGGPCRVGIESTVLDLTRDRPAILRPGAITRDQIVAILGPVELQTAADASDRPARSPGRQPVHYAPATPAYRFASGDMPQVIAWRRTHLKKRAAFLLLHSTAAAGAVAPLINESDVLVPLPSMPVDYARELYSQLRRADALGVDALFIELPPDEAQWAAVRDRVWRATRSLSDIEQFK